MRRTLGFVLLLGGLFVLTSVSLSQAPGGGGKLSKFGNINPDEIFEKYAKGKDAIIFSELDPRDQQRLQFLSSMMGIKIEERTTREQFKEHFSKVTTMVQSGQLPLKGMGGGATPPAAPSANPSVEAPKGGAPAFGGPPRDRDAIMESIFRRMDKNNDGTLTADEIPENMQSDREAYDKNHDGVIDLEEFKKFANDRRPPKEGDNTSRVGGENGNPTEQGGTSIDRGARPNPDEMKPTIYRMGNLPKDLPEWFARLDKAGDCDGQVGLWEARNDKAVLADFEKYDLNGDGIITAEEILKYKGIVARKSGGGEDTAGRSRESRWSGGSAAASVAPSTNAYPGTTSVPTQPAPQTGAPPVLGNAVAPPIGGGTPPNGNGFGGFRGTSGNGSTGFTPAQGSGLTPRTDGGSSSGDRPSFSRPSGSGDSGSGGSGFRGFGKGFGRSSSGNGPPTKN